MTNDQAFEAFWSAFPRGRKTAKAEARRKFVAIVSGRHKDLRATAEQLIAGAARYAHAMGDHHQFVKMPSTWLNGGCWEDEDLAPPMPVAVPVQGTTRRQDLLEKLQDRSWADER